MSIKYTYSISADFPNHKVATDRLAQEIHASVIATALDFIGTSGDNCDIWFRADLSDFDQSILSTVVSVHSGEPLPENVIQDVNIKQATATVPSIPKGFPDYTGYPRLVKGVKGDMAASQRSYVYVSFDKTVMIQGGGLWVPPNASWGDFIDVELTYGVGGPVVGQFVSTLYTRAGYETTWTCVSEDAQPLPPGICIRLGYTNVGQEAVRVTGYYTLRRTPNA